MCVTGINTVVIMVLHPQQELLGRKSHHRIKSRLVVEKPVPSEVPGWKYQLKLSNSCQNILHE